MPLSDLFGLLSSSPKVVPAPPLASYPTSEDAANALKYGFGAGDPRMDGYVTGQSARLLGDVTPSRPGGAPVFMARSGATIGDLGALTAAVDNGQSVNRSPAPFGMSDVYARAALAANRIPIAALGFDPSRMVADTEMKNPTVGGAYSPSNDGVYFNMPPGQTPSTPVHESIHRGLEILRKDPANGEAFRNSPDEETIVRYIMAKQAGDPEQGRGDAGDRQRKNALTVYDTLDSGRYARGLDALTRAAEDAIKNRRPGGPR